jgi:protein-S-isoprenylcysteine O-methyltransferase Ste14
MDPPLSLTRILLRFAILVVVLAAALFGSAGTLHWPAAWIYIGLYLAFALTIGPWLYRHNPSLLRERMHVGKRAVKPWDRTLMRVLTAVFVPFLLLPGLDAVRFRWSQVPDGVQAVAFAALFAAYVLFVLVLRANTFLSRVVEVQQDRGHRVVSTGPYAVVRHPMYAAATLLYLATPVALGSFWGLVPAAFVAMGMVVRILLEERTLREELEGYDAYTRTVRWRLLPGVW